MISSDLWWEFRANGSWGIGDRLATLWGGPSGPQPVNGRLPWDPPGVTASWSAVNGTVRTYVSKDLYWRRSFANGAWSWSQGHVNTLQWWSSAPPDAGTGHRPWEGDGVTAVFRAAGRLWIISKDKYWRLDEGTGSWQNGRLIQIWSGAPASVCGTPPPVDVPPTDPVCPGQD